MFKHVQFFKTRDNFVEVNNNEISLDINTDFEVTTLADFPQKNLKLLWRN
ncbi:hypothetical protein BN1325_50012 [Staphylococcus aureus]|nr:hypothetical protein BN1323_50013 [Staphylococcus aureus]CRI25321.1 hypothetical protein BN1322_50013 [Staphylococcus aureus]CRI25574.1 hypothetical protein SAET23_50012 [Staphylococcus aureus]CRI29727.1 hypothetical protein BN1325_50012 [Staphylococcus aureus]CRI29873.1 hypothetical protein SAET23_50012 [Staphylococcus aureus]